MTDLGTIKIAEGDSTSMFASPLAPDVSISGLSVFRSTLTYSPRSDDDEELKVKWSISGLHVDEGDETLHLMGDLRCRQEGWFVGVTCLAVLSFRDPEKYLVPGDSERLGELVLAFGPWVSHALYDLASTAARTQVALNSHRNMQIPGVTPTTTIVNRNSGQA